MKFAQMRRKRRKIQKRRELEAGGYLKKCMRSCPPLLPIPKPTSWKGPDRSQESRWIPDLTDQCASTVRGTEEQDGHTDTR